jgi:hypothetical protein
MRLAVLLSVLLVGCATQPETVWMKPGASQFQFDTDFGQCNAQAWSVASGNLYQIAMVQRSCLEGKGWRLVAR